MDMFHAKVPFYVHAYAAINDWFGNRGIELPRGSLKEWCYRYPYLYYVCGENAPEVITQDDGDVVVCVLSSICYECDHVLRYEDSPFAGRVTS